MDLIQMTEAVLQQLVLQNLIAMEWLSFKRTIPASEQTSFQDRSAVVMVMPAQLAQELGMRIMQSIQATLLQNHPNLRTLQGFTVQHRLPILDLAAVKATANHTLCRKSYGTLQQETFPRQGLMQILPGMLRIGFSTYQEPPQLKLIVALQSPLRMVAEQAIGSRHIEQLMMMMAT